MKKKCMCTRRMYLDAENLDYSGERKLDASEKVK